MNPNPTPPLEIESLLTADQRRVVSVSEHAAFLAGISRPVAFDQINEAVECFRPIQRKSNREISRLDSIFDEILVEQLRAGAFEETGGRP